MPNPGAFKGARKDFLMSQKQTYATAVAEDNIKETVMSIQRRFFKRFPLDKPVTYEPTAEELALVDDDVADAETVPIGPLSESDRELSETRRQLAEFRKGQIARWLAYQYARDNGKQKKADVSLLDILRQLTGKEACRPRMKTPANVWRKTQRDAIDREYERQAALARLRGQPVKSSNKVADRDRIAREMYAALPKSEQERWKKVAKEEHEAAMEMYDGDNELSTDPADRQRAIQSIVEVMQPILDLLCEATGWKATLLVGGPEPAKDGLLNPRKNVEPVPSVQTTLFVLSSQYVDASITEPASAAPGPSQQTSNPPQTALQPSVPTEVRSMPPVPPTMSTSTSNSNPFPFDLPENMSTHGSPVPSPVTSRCGTPVQDFTDRTPNVVQPLSGTQEIAPRSIVHATDSLAATSADASALPHREQMLVPSTGKKSKKKGKKAGKATTSTAEATRTREKRKATAPLPDAPTAPAPPPRKRVKHSFYYEDARGNRVNKWGIRVDNNGNPLPLIDEPDGADEVQPQ
uniref:Uncharacterized protein n=1 Tax=Psilocybe cubensis TaxID=181762 RepID=A0A8H8CFR3_PSICU